MMMVDRQTVEAVLRKLAEPKRTGEVVDEVERLLRIRESRLWRAEAGSCCSP